MLIMKQRVDCIDGYDRIGCSDYFLPLFRKYRTLIWVLGCLIQQFCHKKNIDGCLAALMFILLCGAFPKHCPCIENHRKMV